MHSPSMLIAVKTAAGILRLGLTDCTSISIPFIHIQYYMISVHNLNAYFSEHMNLKKS